jgi:hypothetical protein
MKKNVFLVLLSILFVSNAFPQARVASDDNKVRETQFENLNISMVLVKKQSDGTSIKINWSEEPINITAETILVEGKTINELLRKNNISPDVEALGVVYALNPGIKKLNQANITELRIPKVQGGQSLQQLFNQGALVFLTVDKELKKQFSEEVKKLNNLTQKVKGLEDQKFSDTNTRTSILNTLNSVSSALKGINTRIIQRTGRFVPTEVIKQLNAQTQLLNININAAISSEKKIGKEELEQINNVEEDVKIKVKTFTIVASGEPPERYPEVTVSVKTLKQGKEIPSLRIYYVPKALRNKPQEAGAFGELSSPSNQKLPEANYCFWGARDPSRAAVTNVHCQPILDGQGIIRVQLTVNP